MTFETPDEAMAKAMEWMAGSLITLAADVGFRSGLLGTAAEVGPATSAELAEAGGFSERHVREWLDLMASGGLFTYDPATGRYTLPAGWTAILPMFAATAEL